MNYNNCTDTIHATPLSWGQWIGEGKRLALGEARKTTNLLALWQRRATARRAMVEMDERIMDDAGLSRQDIQQEAAKPFWKA